MLSQSVVSNWDLSLAKTHVPVSGPNEAQVLGVSLQKYSVRDIAKRYICLDSERSTVHRMCAIAEGVAMKCGVVSFCELGNELEDHSNNWGTIHSWVF